MDCSWHSLWQVLTVHQSDSLWKETVHVSGCFGVQSSVAPTRGEKFKRVMSNITYQYFKYFTLTLKSNKIFKWLYNFVVSGTNQVAWTTLSTEISWAHWIGPILLQMLINGDCMAVCLILFTYDWGMSTYLYFWPYSVHLIKHKKQCVQGLNLSCKQAQFAPIAVVYLLPSQMQSFLHRFIQHQFETMYTSLPFISRRNVTQFGGVPNHRWSAISGWQHHHVCDGHKPVKQPQGPDGTPQRSAERIQQQPTGNLLENTQRSVHTAGWKWEALLLS